MSPKYWFRAALVLFAVSVLAAGCGKPEEKSPPAVSKDKELKHNTWWCDEHGVPEAECSICSPKAAKAFKDKGDWCDKHERAKSQCFICDPSLREKYAARYRAKYGKEPPEPTDNMPGKEDSKKDEKK